MINRARGTRISAAQFLADCRARARDEEIFQQSYLCNPLGATSNHIVEWSAIERCRQDYEIERLHLEAEEVRQRFGEFTPYGEDERESQIGKFLRSSFSALFSASDATLRLGFDVGASGQGDLATIYIDEARGDELSLRALFTCRTEDWHFLKTVLYYFLKHLESVQAAGDETGLGRQICWEAAGQFGSNFFSVNFASKKQDLGFALMNQLSVTEKRFPKSEQDIAAYSQLKQAALQLAVMYDMIRGPGEELKSETCAHCDDEKTCHASSVPDCAPYVVIASLWIILSDRLLESLFSDPAARMQWSIYKGWAFVLVTALLLSALLRVEWRARERAEEELSRSEADLTEAQRVAKLGSWRSDIATDTVRWSRELYRIFEIEEKAFGGSYEDFLSCIHPDDRPRVLQTNAEARAGGKPFEVEYRVVTRAGQVKIIREIGYAVTNAMGKMVGLFGTAQDITERKRAEEELQQTNARLQVILGASPIPILGVAADGRIMSWNEAAERVFGWSAKEAIGRMCPTVAPRELDDYLEMIRRAMQGEPSLGLVRHHQKKNGSLLLCRVSAAPQRNTQGQPVGVTVLLEDVTEREQAEEALRESEQRLRLLDDNLPGSYVYQYTRELGATPRFLYLSAGVERVHGVKAEAGLRDASTLRHQAAPEQLAALEEAESASLEDLSDFEMELRVCRADGQWRWVQLRSRPRRNSEGQVIWDGVATDITQRKQAELDARRSRAQLRALLAQLQRLREEERTRMAREVHDVLGQLLTGLKMDMSWWERRFTKIADEPLRHALEEKVEATSRLADMMIETVQKISRDLRPSVLDNIGLGAALQFEARQFQGRTGIVCDVSVPSETFSLEPDLATGIFRVFQELLTNVTRHAQATRVIAALKQTAENVTLEVNDNGRGIREEELNDPKSLGLLGMTERASLMGGRFEIHGSPGGGTTAALTIPVAPG